jgi:TPR repeat protein
VKRGEDFTAAGDFVSARLVFQRAAETGDAKAALMLAETYDPNVLGRLWAKGVAPDIAMARLWYEKAKDLGSPEAQRRLDRLDQAN